MSRTTNNSKTKERIQQLLVALASEATEDTMQNAEAQEHKWQQCYYFNHKQLENIDIFAEKTAKAITSGFTKLYQSEFNVTVASSTLHFSEEFLSAALDEKKLEYYLPITDEQGSQYGVIGIPNQTAFAWTKQLLGDKDSEKDSKKELSQLEESLLLDIVGTFVDAFSSTYDNHDFHHANTFTRAKLPFELENTDELCKTTFTFEKLGSKDNSEAYLLIPCKKLEPLAYENAGSERRASNEDLSKIMLEHAQQISVSVTAMLGSSMTSFEEIMNLSVDDILLLDKKVNEPVELVVGGKTLFEGYPVKSAGKYAIAITQLAPDMLQNTTAKK